jgi:hypothetical protein
VSWTYYWAAGGHAAQPLYSQFDHGGCRVGCGAVAWAMLIGWGDRQAETGNAYWQGRWGLYRLNGGRGANDIAPLTQHEGIRNVIREIRGQIGTFCAFGSGATWPWRMDGVVEYLRGRTYTRISAHWNSLGIHEGGLRNRAVTSIRDRRTPAIIGTGWLNHYPVAYGYAWRTRIVRRCLIWCWTDEVTDRWFYVTQGWGGRGNDWVEAGTWFAASIYP